MALDIFKTRTMLKALEQMLFPKLFLRDMFFRGTERSTTKYVDIDIMKGKRRLAPFVSPLKEGKQVERLGFTTNTIEPPYIKPKMITNAQDFLDRGLGETIYSGGKTAAQKAQEQLGKDLAELNGMIDRREEWMASSALTTGKIVISGDGVSREIDFLMAGTHLITLTGNDLWTDTTNSDPLANLKTWKRLIGKDSGLVPDAVIMGETAWDNFIKHPKVVAALDTRRIDLGIIDPKALPNGATYMGFLKETQQDIYTYDEWYLDASDVLQPMVPAKKVIMGSTKLRATKHYGAIYDLEMRAAVSRFPKSWTEKDPSRQILLLQSAPVMALHQPDAIICATVIG